MKQNKSKPYTEKVKHYQNIFKFNRLLTVTELAFCTSVEHFSVNKFITHKAQACYSILLAIILLTLQIFGMNSIVKMIKFLFGYDMSDWVMIVSQLTLTTSVASGLIITVFTSGNIVQTYNDLLQSKMSFDLKLIKLHVLPQVNKILKLLLGFNLFILLGNIVISIQLINAGFNFLMVMCLTFLFHLQELYLLFTKIYWIQIMLIVKESLADIKYKLVQDLHINRWKHNKEDKSIKINSMSDQFFFLLQMVNTFSYRFTPQLLAFCVKYVISGTPTFFYVIKNLMQRRDITNDLFSTILWHGYLWTLMVIVLSAYVSIIKEVSEVATVIHDLVSTGEVDDNTEELFNFSTAILHNDFHFSACGFFRVDYTLIFMVVSKVVSYLVMLIQFHVSTSSFNDAHSTQQPTLAIN